MSARILIVEDYCKTAVALGDALRLEGFDVRICLDGREAIEAARTFDPNVLLLDWMLPGGIDAPSVIREVMAASPAVAIIVLTGLPELFLKADIRSVRICRLLLKPITLEEVTETVREAAAMAESRPY